MPIFESLLSVSSILSSAEYVSSSGHASNNENIIARVCGNLTFQTSMQIHVRFIGYIEGYAILLSTRFIVALCASHSHPQQGTKIQIP